MKPQPKVFPQPPSKVPRRAGHDTSKGQQRRAGERAGEGANGIRPYLEQERKDRISPTNRERSR